ncbi:MAG: DUF423 domain-containing protein [Chitinophagaceae bacterium]|jgi:uncharacterized membrane protein YgdD (TMEM256/DUF423 family)|nr:DUF423 domain-containing protein [Chitinophagaceae bacterium]
MRLRPTIWGTAMSGVAVILGAFGAHALTERLEPPAIEVFKTAVQYQMYHGLALILTGILLKSKPSKNIANAALSFIIGIFLFSGSLYLITLGKLTNSELSWIGPITPIGGLAFIIGWGLLVYHQVSKR